MKAPKHPERLPALIAYVADIQARMNLQAWIIIATEKRNPDAYATIRPWHTQRMRADLLISPQFWLLSADDLRDAVVHELLHLLHRDMDDSVRESTYWKQAGQMAYDRVYDPFKVEEERVVDMTARILSPLMPMPPKGMMPK